MLSDGLFYSEKQDHSEDYREWKDHPECNEEVAHPQKQLIFLIKLMRKAHIESSWQYKRNYANGRTAHNYYK